MNAPSTIGAGKPTLRIRGTSYPVLLPTLRDPRLHLAAVIVSLQVLGSGGVRVPPLDRADPRLAAHLRGARDGDRLPAPARDPLARERAPDRKRRRLHPPRARDGARRLVEHARLVDLRRDGCGVAALQASDPVPGRAHLQPLELRPRPLLPAPRLRVRRPARVLVGADVVLARARARDHRRRRLRDPAAAAAAAHRRHVLGHLRRQHRRARGERPRHDGALARRPGLGLVLLARSRLLARDPRLPVLHDHRPEDDPGGTRRAPGLRGLDRAAGGAADRAADDGVRLQGGRALGAGARLRGAARARAGRRSRCAGAAGRVEADALQAWPRSPGRWRSSACWSSPGFRPARAPRRRVLPASSSSELVAVTVQPATGNRADRRANRSADRARPRRRSGERVGGAPPARPRACDGRCRRRPPRRAVAADRGGARRRPTSPATRSSGCG